MQNSTEENVIDFQKHKDARDAESRRERNEKFAEVILSRWNDKGPASGKTLFTAIVNQTVFGPVATPERSKVLLPVLLEVLDEMEASTDGN